MYWRLASFLFASAALHAAMFMVWSDSDFRLLVQDNAGLTQSTSLSVSFQQDNQLSQEIKPAQEPVLEKSAPKKTLQKNIKTESPETLNPTPQTEPVTESFAKQQTTIAPGNAEVNRAEIKILVNDKFEHYFYYPMMAKRNGWQGQVLLAYTLTPEGFIVDVHVKKGSAYRIFDHSAVDAMSKVKYIDTGEKHLPSQPIQLTQNVAYRLSD